MQRRTPLIFLCNYLIQSKSNYSSDMEPSFVLRFDLYHVNMSMFAFLLFCSIPSTCFGIAMVSHHEIVLYVVILHVQLICVLNLLIRDMRIQQYAHDVFVYVLVYGLTSSLERYTMWFSTVVATAMLCTRYRYNRCIFLYWNIARNIDYDFIVLFLILYCCVRTERLLEHFHCICIGAISHFFEDDEKKSYILRAIAKLKRY